MEDDLMLKCPLLQEAYGDDWMPCPDEGPFQENTSFYLVILQIHPGGARKGLFAVYSSLEEVKSLLEEDFSFPSLGMALAESETMVVQWYEDGKLVGEVDVHPYVSWTIPQHLGARHIFFRRPTPPWSREYLPSLQELAALEARRWGLFCWKGMPVELRGLLARIGFVGLKRHPEWIKEGHYIGMDMEWVWDGCQFRDSHGYKLDKVAAPFRMKVEDEWNAKVEEAMEIAMENSPLDICVHLLWDQVPLPKELNGKLLKKGENVKAQTGYWLEERNGPTPLRYGAQDLDL